MPTPRSSNCGTDDSGYVPHLFYGLSFGWNSIGCDSSCCVFLTAWLGCLVSVPVVRSMVRRYYGGCDWWGDPVLIFGNGRAGCDIYQALRKNPELGLRPVAVVGHTDQPYADLASIDAGHWEDAAELASRHSASTMIMAMADCHGTDTMRLIEQHAHVLTNGVVVPDMGGFASLWATATNCGGLIGIQSTEQLALPGLRLAKRVIDGLLTLMVRAARLAAAALDRNPGAAHVEGTRFLLATPPGSQRQGIPPRPLEVSHDGSEIPRRRLPVIWRPIQRHVWNGNAITS